jgi:Uma2 family endonuclease
MAMPKPHPVPGEWTVEDLWALPQDGNRYEIVGGVLLVTPAPRAPHQRALGKLHLLLAPYVERMRAGEVLLSPADIVFGPRDLVQPDLFVAPLIDGRKPRDWKEITRLMLAVEVLSPSTARQDRGAKRRLYQEHADEFWVVDLAARCVERWLPASPAPEVLTASMTWQPAGAGEALTLDLPAYFREVWDE